jgi:uncharacterized protein YndB with AHSA1/START domain
MPQKPRARRAGAPFRTSFSVAPRELSFLRANAASADPARASCIHCGRTPLVGEVLHVYEATGGDRHVRALPPAPSRGPGALGARAFSRAPPRREGPHARRVTRVGAGRISSAPVDPVTATVTIGRPREEVFDYLADIANLPEFSDHYMDHFRLTRVDSVGEGAGARFHLDAPLARFSWGDLSYVELNRPHRIVAIGRGGKFNRNKTTTIWTLDPSSGGGTELEMMTEVEPALPTDRFMESVTGYRRWMKRNVRKSLRRLQSILEEDYDRGERATVAGV